MIETYAPFVWTCYAVTVAVWVLNIYLARRSLSQEVAAARRRLQVQSSGKS